MMYKALLVATLQPTNINFPPKKYVNILNIPSQLEHLSLREYIYVQF